MNIKRQQQSLWTILAIFLVTFFYANFLYDYIALFETPSFGVFLDFFFLQVSEPLQNIYFFALALLCLFFLFQGLLSATFQYRSLTLLRYEKRTAFFLVHLRRISLRAFFAGAFVFSFLILFCGYFKGMELAPSRFGLGYLLHALRFSLSFFLLGLLLFYLLLTKEVVLALAATSACITLAMLGDLVKFTYFFTYGGQKATLFLFIQLIFCIAGSIFLFTNKKIDLM